MSVESMAIALHHSRARGATKLMLIGIANHDGDGGAWPSLRTLMKYAGVTDRRNAQRSIRQLELLGEVECLVSRGGDHQTAEHLRPNLYKFKLTCPADCDHSKNHRTKREGVVIEFDFDPAAHTPPGGPQAAGTSGEQAAPPAASTPPEPSLNRTHQSPALNSATEVDEIEAKRRRKCPLRSDGGEHVHIDGNPCAWCGIRLDQFWDGKEIKTIGGQS